MTHATTSKNSNSNTNVFSSVSKHIPAILKSKPHKTKPETSHVKPHTHTTNTIQPNPTQNIQYPNLNLNSDNRQNFVHPIPKEPVIQSHNEE